MNFDILNSYATNHSSPQSDILNELEQETKNTVKMAGMMCGPLVARLLQTLCKVTGTKNVIEVGTFTGYSTLAIAEALPDDGKIITHDINTDTTSVGKKYWQKSSHGKKIELVIGKAIETIPKLDLIFDFAFIDADKQNYPNYYELILPKLRKNGLIAIDNVNWGSFYEQGENYPDYKVMDEFNKFVNQDRRVENVFLPVRSGVNIIRKL